VDEDVVGPAAQQLGEIGLAQVERQRPQVVATERRDVEGVELSSERGARGEYHCPVCDTALEIFDGNHLPWAPNRER